MKTIYAMHTSIWPRRAVTLPKAGPINKPSSITPTLTHTVNVYDFYNRMAFIRSVPFPRHRAYQLSGRRNCNHHIPSFIIHDSNKCFPAFQRVNRLCPQSYCAQPSDSSIQEHFSLWICFYLVVWLCFISLYGRLRQAKQIAPPPDAEWSRYKRHWLSDTRTEDIKEELQLAKEGGRAGSTNFANWTRRRE